MWPIRTLRFALTVTVAAISTTVLSAQGPSEQPLVLPIRSQVDSLLKELDAPKLIERTQAERNLLDLGPEALKYLPAPEVISNVSIREAVKRIRIQLERRAARESALPSRVQITGDVPLATAIKELAGQTRNAIELNEDAIQIAAQVRHVDLVNQTFWESLDQICEEWNLKSSFNPQRSALSLRLKANRDVAPLLIQRSGPFRIAVTSAEVRDIVGDSSKKLLRVAARINLEPRLRPLFLHFAATDLHAFDSDGARLSPWNSAASYELPVGDAGREIPMQFDFIIPNDSDSPAIDVQGRVSVQLAAATERIVFDQTSQTPGALRRRGGVSVRLREVKFEPQADGTLEAMIGVGVTFDAGGPAFESHRTWMYHNAVYLETEAGKRVDFTEYNTSQTGDGAIVVDYRWEKLPTPPTQFHFVYEAPTLILDVPVELKLQKIPLTRPRKSQP